ncbi:MAG: Fe-S cluster assembly protein SufD [Acidimicrobiia bacterium]|nr:Fe-S cluster assembly protein SufD [Acidimicrobiia bacterium]
MSIFSTTAARGIAGEPWLQQWRAEAAERWEASVLPSPDEEIWRYSRIAELDLGAYHLPAAAVQPVPEAHLARLRALNPSALIVLINGLVAHREIGQAAEAAGVEFGPVGSAGLLGSVMSTPVDVFAELNNAFCTTPLVLNVPRNVVLEGPVVVVNALLDAGAALFPRLVIRAGANSEVRVLEQHLSGPVAGFVAPVVEIYADQAARVRYLALNQLGNDVWQIGSQVAVAERDSTVSVSAVALGGAYARTRIDARAQGRGAHVEQIAVYFGEGTQMHDFRTLQDHAGPKTTSELLFKGAVEGHSRSVYSGLIKVRKEAVGTRAFQTNRNIKLSEGAWAESVPNLDIETNDVQCSHASSVGPIDEDQRFYLESRGVPPEVAERLIVLGFFDEVLTRLPIPELLPALRQAVSEKLARKDLQ